MKRYRFEIEVRVERDADKSGGGVGLDFDIVADSREQALELGREYIRHVDGQDIPVNAKDFPAIRNVILYAHADGINDENIVDEEEEA